MELRRKDFPVALQAYDVRENNENFVAEQVVNTQAEAETFMSLYAGKLIKTRPVRGVESRTVHNRTATRSVFPMWIVLLVLVVLFFIVAYALGWLQIWFPQLNNKL